MLGKNFFKFGLNINLDSMNCLDFVGQTSGSESPYVLLRVCYSLVLLRERVLLLYHRLCFLSSDPASWLTISEFVQVNGWTVKTHTTRMFKRVLSCLLIIFTVLL